MLTVHPGDTGVAITEGWRKLQQQCRSGITHSRGDGSWRLQNHGYLEIDKSVRTEQNMTIDGEFNIGGSVKVHDDSDISGDAYIGLDRHQIHSVHGDFTVFGQGHAMKVFKVAPIPPPPTMPTTADSLKLISSLYIDRPIILGIT